MKYQNLIWDWNGTLLNDVELCTTIANELLEPHPGNPMSVATYKDIFSFPVIDYYRNVGFDFNLESFAVLTEKFMGQYMKRIKEESLHFNAKELLHFFKSKGIAQYILSAAHKNDLSILTEHFNVHHFFEEIEGLSNREAASKVEVGKSLVANFHFTVENTLMIGDTFHDYEVAEAIGVDCILVASGHQSKKQLTQQISATKIVDNLTELKSIIT